MKKNTVVAIQCTKTSRSKIIVLVLMPILLGIVALTVGRYPVSLADIWQAFTGFFGSENNLSDTVRTVIFDIRIPRIIAAILIGMALSVSGAAFQGTFKNPLVSPDILGVSAGAGFGATLAIVYSWGSLGIAISAFAFGLLAVWLTYFIGNLIKNSGEITLILAFLTTKTANQLIMSPLFRGSNPYPYRNLTYRIHIHPIIGFFYCQIYQIPFFF